MARPVRSSRRSAIARRTPRPERPDRSPAAAPRRALPPGKRRLFAAATLALPFLILGAAEGALRLAGVGADHPLFVPADSSGAFLTMNPRVSERYFFGDYTAPGATFDPFRAEKSAGAFRIFVQGGSSALGFPWFYGGAFPRMLGDRLQRELPAREIEVVNTALTAVSSHTLRDFADEIAAQEPDAVLVYAGHNEYYGAFGVASSRSGGALPGLVPAYLALRRLRLVQATGDLVRGALGRVAGPGGEGRPGGGGTTMERMVGEREIPLDSELFEAGRRQLARNLHALLEVYEAAGVPVYLATLISNERHQPPFISRPDPDVPAEAWASAMDEARAALEAGDTARARTALAGPAAQDETNAGAFFAAARLLDGAGDVEGARTLYRAARDRDLLRFRAPGAFNDVIREEAAEHGAVLVDVLAAFEDASPDGVVGHALVSEHLHPTLDGYFTMADAFHGALRQRGAIGDWSGALPRGLARATIPATVVDSIYGTLLLESLVAGWPFQLDPDVERERLEALDRRRGSDPVERIALALFRRQISWPAATVELFAHYEREGRADLAAGAARALARELRLSPEPWELMARAALVGDSLELALERIRQGARLAPTYRGEMLAGSILLRLGRHAEAVERFERAVTLAPPADPTPRAVLGAARSLPDLERRAAAAPGDADAWYALAEAWALTNLTDSARAALARVRDLEPGSARADRLEAMLEGGDGG